VLLLVSQLPLSSGSSLWGYGLDRAGAGEGQVAVTCECSNELTGSLKCGNFLSS